jgi:hypothetical protein
VADCATVGAISDEENIFGRNSNLCDKSIFGSFLAKFNGTLPSGSQQVEVRAAGPVLE